MAKGPVIMLLMISVMLGIPPTGHCQIPNPPGAERARERLRLQRAIRLQRDIRQRWTPQRVRAIMGEPERTERSTVGPDRLDVWYYHDFDVRIEFRNGLVSKWFSRFTFPNRRAGRAQ